MLIPIVITGYDDEDGIEHITGEFFVDRTPGQQAPDKKQGFKKIPIPDNLRWKVWERDNFTCVLCGQRTYLCVDHIIPESRGGQATLENLQTLCRTCNSRKGAR